MILPVMSPRTVLLIGALSLTSGWLLGTSTSSTAVPIQADRMMSGSRPLGSSANSSQAGGQQSQRRRSAAPAGNAPLTRQLRQRMDAQPHSTPAVGRNPFAFGASRPAAVRAQREEAAAELPAPVALAPPAPLFKLSGIASSLVDGTTVLTAIINDNGSLAFVKTGEPLSNGYRVVRVEETGVVIVDAAGITQTLRLP